MAFPEIKALATRTPSSENFFDDTAPCKACDGNGWHDVWKKVSGHYEGGEIFRDECEICEGTGRK